MNQTELLLDALEYYTVDPVGRRCKDEDACYYSPKSIGKEGISQGCIVGRLLPPELAEAIDAKYTKGITSLWESEDFELPDFINKDSIQFLQLCQELHDGDTNWTEIGLSYRGKNKVISILDEYELDKSKFEKFLN